MNCPSCGKPMKEEDKCPGCNNCKDCCTCNEPEHDCKSCGSHHHCGK